MNNIREWAAGFAIGERSVPGPPWAGADPECCDRRCHLSVFNNTYNIVQCNII